MPCSPIVEPFFAPEVKLLRIEALRGRASA